MAAVLFTNVLAHRPTFQTYVYQPTLPLALTEDKTWTIPFRGRLIRHLYLWIKISGTRTGDGYFRCYWTDYVEPAATEWMMFPGYQAAYGTAHILKDAMLASWLVDTAAPQAGSSNGTVIWPLIETTLNATTNVQSKPITDGLRCEQFKFDFDWTDLSGLSLDFLRVGVAYGDK